MSVNISSGLIGLTLLSGNNSLGEFQSAFKVESRAVRDAKAQFTLPQTRAPWLDAPASTSLATQVSLIRRMASIVDAPSARDQSLPGDVLTTFTAYKALERLRILAESALKTTVPATTRTDLAATFDKGLADLRGFLASAPSDKLQLAFAQPSRRDDSVTTAKPDYASKTLGAGLLDSRTAPLAGITGSEIFTLTLRKNGVSDSVSVDLSTTPQPPTLDSVAAAFNAAIAAIPQRAADGSIVLDASGNPVPQYLTRFAADKASGTWGLAVDTPGTEEIALDQDNAADALIVASGRTVSGSPETTLMMRFDDPLGGFSRTTLGTIAAIDRAATERAALSVTDGTTPPPVSAQTASRGIAVDAMGFTYVVGTSSGDLGSNLTAGQNDLFLTKMDSEGKVVWQRSLGAGTSASGAALTIAANGDVVVAGTVTGPFDGSLSTDGDMLVARFDGNGKELFATSVRAVGNDEASAIALAADGSILIGGRTDANGGSAFVGRLSATGQLLERSTIAAGSVTALALDANGSLLALTRENGLARLHRLDPAALSNELGMLELGAADARAIAVSASGEIAVVGATSSTLTGTQSNSPSGGRDGFVARVDPALWAVSVTYIGSGNDDQIDSATYMGYTLYLGGRTTGALDGSRRGTVDGFVTSIDTTSGAIGTIRQFGQPEQSQQAVLLAAAPRGSGATGALGFHRGWLNTREATDLVAQTSLRKGDEFSLRVDGGALRKVVIAAGETLATLSEKIGKLAGANVKVSTAAKDGGLLLRIEAREGHQIELLAGSAGKDALEKLGLAPARLAAATPPAPKAPRVRPGGSYGLNIKEGISLATAADAAAALKQINAAISMTRTAYRSLYWDDSKAAMVNGAGGGRLSPYQQAQLARYEDALTRLGGR